MALDWEKIGKGPRGGDIHRTKVFGGWIVCQGYQINMTFVPDKNHEWKVE